jgi:hypothetical protein
MAFTRVRRVLAKETGLPFGRVGKALSKHKASAGSLTYTITARSQYFKITGGNFGARQVRKGVSHRAWGRRQVADGAFIPKGMSVAFKRLGPKRLPIKALYGPSIPREMIRGQSGAVIRQMVATVFIPRALHELRREIVRVKSKYGL